MIPGIQLLVRANNKIEHLFHFEREDVSCNIYMFMNTNTQKTTMISAKVQKRKRLIFHFFGNKSFIGIIIVINNYVSNFSILLPLIINCLIFR